MLHQFVFNHLSVASLHPLNVAKCLKKLALTVEYHNSCRFNIVFNVLYRLWDYFYLIIMNLTLANALSAQKLLSDLVIRVNHLVMFWALLVILKFRHLILQVISLFALFLLNFFFTFLLFHFCKVSPQHT